MLKLGTQVCLRTLNFAKLSVVKVVEKSNRLLPNAPFVRSTSFFNKFAVGMQKMNSDKKNLFIVTQQELWKGVLSVSNAGRRKGRGRGLENKKKNLNLGKKPGEGKIRISWPGLNISTFKGSELMEIKELPKTESDVLPTEMKIMKHRKLNPLERGWSGRQTRGKRMGPPEPLLDQTFEGFDSVVLEHKSRTHMTSIFGRKKHFVSIVATGNSNGLIGFGFAKCIDRASSLKTARKKASKRLLPIDLIDKSTVNHDFLSQYGRTRITVLKKPDGYGLICHRLIKAICQLIGIKNLYAKVEGPKNAIHMIRAFVLGLIRQKTYQEIADENKLHLVEFKKETLDFPRVLASPQKCLTPEEVRKNPVLFEEYIMGNKLRYECPPKKPFYEKLPSWQTHLKRTVFKRNHKEAVINLIAKNGERVSHLSKIYSVKFFPLYKNPTADDPQ